MSREYLSVKEKIDTPELDHIQVFLDKNAATLIFVFSKGWDFAEVNRSFAVTEKVTNQGHAVAKTFLDMEGAGFPGFGVFSTEKVAVEKAKRGKMLPVYVLGVNPMLATVVRAAAGRFSNLEFMGVNSYEEVNPNLETNPTQLNDEQG
jgi:hypothetical protein